MYYTVLPIVSCLTSVVLVYYNMEIEAHTCYKWIDFIICIIIYI